MRRIATYLRACNPDGPSSAPAQRAFFETWLAAHPDDVRVLHFEDLDADAGGRFFERKGSRALTEAMRAGEIDALLVSSGDRLTRYQDESVLLQGLRRKYKVRLITQHSVDEEKDESVLYERLIEAFNAFSRMQRQDAARRGAATRRANRLARETAAKNPTC